MNGRAWTKREIATVRRDYPNLPTAQIAATLDRPMSGVYRCAYALGLEKSAAFRASPLSGRLVKGCAERGRATRFVKGQKSWNTGTKGIVTGGVETQFKKGNRPHTWKPLGSERLLDGYLCRKMTDTGYSPRDWVPVHILMWREAFGAIPPKHTVCFKDKDRTHIRLDNLELVSREELMRRNSYHTNYPREIAQLIQLRGAVQRQINRRERHEKQD